MTAYTRDNPSPEYRAMVAMYETLHEEGESAAGKSGKQTFPGKMLIRHAPGIKEMIDHTGARDILDYGAGKGVGYTLRNVALKKGLEVPSIQEYWGVEDIRCYDPGHEPFKDLPDHPYDGVIATDVLEHITAPDVPWIVDEMFSYARQFLYANVACYPAVKVLPNGQNVHCTIRPPDWWAGVFHAIAMRHTTVSYRLIAVTATGRRKKFGFAKNRRKEYHVHERMV
ncbi:MAG: class I SAM-dependent methyltransferase [Rhodobacteraceae bacterium CG17_big_fil_post_rev_8_21_14_2_50_63_15]|nr:MAG: class I SAM-dependent methyltransferase [Rhodobacteraceae bacterium CG17_big_fil_post_rev_8_21_14_2_50_63_15]